MPLTTVQSQREPHHAYIESAHIQLLEREREGEEKEGNRERDSKRGERKRERESHLKCAASFAWSYSRSQS
jgi:hypothetical protein